MKNKKRAQAWGLKSFAEVKSKRAQAWGFDLVAGLSIFIIGILVFFLYSLNYNSSGDTKLQELQYEATSVGDSLLSNGIINEGGVPKEEYPAGWDYTNDMSDVQKIGLLSEGKVNSTKLTYFYQMSQPAYYEETKRLLNIKDEFWIDFGGDLLVDSDGDGIGDKEGVGLKYDGTEDNIIKNNRVVSFDNKIRNIYIYIWN